MKKRFFALALTLAILCSAILPGLTLTANAGGWMDDYEYDEKNHTLTVNSMDDLSGYLNSEYYWQQLPWFPIRREVEKVILKETVTQIPNYVFREFTAITSVDIPTGVQSIGRCAFFDCSNLEAITIPESVTNIGENAFNFCPKLSEIRVDNNNPKYCNDDSGALLNKDKTNLILFPKGYCGSYTMPNSITTISTDAFLSCTGLTSLILSESLTSLDDYAFNGCSALSSISIPDGLTSIGYYAFGDCVSLTTITLPDSITKIGERAFAGCTALASFSIPKNVTSIENGTFSGCSGLESISIPNSVTSIEGWAFSDCTSLTNIMIPKSVTSIGGWAFSDCTNLTNIMIPKSVTSIGEYAFNRCNNLSGIWVDTNNAVYCSDSCGVLYDKEKTVLILVPPKATLGDYIIPEGVTNIGESGTFYGCTGLTSIVIPSSVASIGDFSFAGCINLTSVTIPLSVTSIGDFSFAGCTSLTSVTIPSSVASIGDAAFYGCTGLTSVTIPDSVTNIDYSAFFGCTALQAVCFKGNAPQCGEAVFSWYDEENQKYINNPNLTLYYVEGKEGWTSPTWNGYPTATWDGVHIPNQEIIQNPFGDVAETAYYFAPVQWAVAKEITTGTAADAFSPEQGCTRAQVVTFLWRAAGKPEPASSANPFTDVAETAYYYKAVLWAVEQGITNGMNADTFGPENTCTRAQIVTFLWRFEGQPAPTSQNNPFTDVNAASYYGSAVLWAGEKAITNGMTATTFCPENTCTRGQIVTFLYRDIANK